ncbi:MAG: 30S ribosome-binding factor RbfA [Calditrichota bacterium]
MQRSNSIKGRRPLRVAAEILREIPEIIRKHVELPDNLFVSIADVTVSDDLSFAKIYFTILGEPDEKQVSRVSHLLNAHKGTVRHEIAQRMVMRQHPDLKFIYDPTPVRAARIEQLLREIRDGNAGDNPEIGEDSA